MAGNTLFGTTFFGGANGNGVIYAINPTGSGFTNLYGFTAYGPGAIGAPRTNIDGAGPNAGLLFYNNFLYGTTLMGGTTGGGTIYAIRPDGTGFTNLYNFTSATGAAPYAGLIAVSNTLYGTTSGGGTSNAGVLFSIKPDGSGYTDLFNFLGGTNAAGPATEMLMSGNVLLGVSESGGSASRGVLFRINLDGSGYTNLHSFTTLSSTSPHTNSDGIDPVRLCTLGGIIYGSTIGGGNANDGIIFAINTDGSGFTNLHNFGPNDGMDPEGLTVSSAGILYGVTFAGGVNNDGTLFQMKTNGSNFTVLYNLKDADGENSAGSILLSGNTLYGTGLYGGIAGDGSVFSLTLPASPLLTLIQNGTNALLHWPTGTVVYNLQATTRLNPPAWTNVTQAPLTLNFQSTVTVPLTGPGMFYRLSQ